MPPAQSDSRLRRGNEPRILGGHPFRRAKDNLLTRGLRTTFGSRIFENYVPDEDSIVVERMKSAGAILIGKNEYA